MRTRDFQSPAEEECSICLDRFYLGEVSPVLVSDCETEVGEVCYACIHAGEDHIQGTLERRAEFSRLIADEDERIAAEGVEDLPSVDELLAVESFYGSGE